MKTKFFNTIKNLLPDFQQHKFNVEKVQSLLEKARSIAFKDTPLALTPEEVDLVHAIDYVYKDQNAIEKLVNLTNNFVESGKSYDATIIVRYHDLPLGDEIAFALIDWAILYNH